MVISTWPWAGTAATPPPPRAQRRTGRPAHLPDPVGRIAPHRLASRGLPARPRAADLPGRPVLQCPPPRPRTGPRHTRLYATLAGKDTALAEVAAQVERRDGPHLAEPGTPWVSLTDGCPALQDRVRARFPGFTLVLDCIHIVEYLWQAGNALLGEAHPRHAAAALGQVAAYLERNLPYIRYDEYLARGWTIATGVIEGACRHLVKDRCELTGMRWTIDGAEALLAPAPRPRQRRLGRLPRLPPPALPPAALPHPRTRRSPCPSSSAWASPRPRFPSAAQPEPNSTGTHPFDLLLFVLRQRVTFVPREPWLHQIREHRSAGRCSVRLRNSADLAGSSAMPPRAAPAPPKTGCGAAPAGFPAARPHASWCDRSVQIAGPPMHLHVPLIHVSLPAGLGWW